MQSNINKGMGLAIAAAALMGSMPATGATASAKNTVQEQRVQVRTQAKKRKGHFPTTGGGRYINQGKYTGAKLREIRKKQAEEIWKKHIAICKEQGIESDIKKDRLVDLW